MSARREWESVQIVIPCDTQAALLPICVSSISTLVSCSGCFSESIRQLCLQVLHIKLLLVVCGFAGIPWKCSAVVSCGKGLDTKCTVCFMEFGFDSFREVFGMNIPNSVLGMFSCNPPATPAATGITNILQRFVYVMFVISFTHK